MKSRLIVCRANTIGSDSFISTTLLQPPETSRVMDREHSVDEPIDIVDDSGKLQQFYYRHEY